MGARGKPGSRKWETRCRMTLRMETFPIGIPLDYIVHSLKSTRLLSAVPTFKEPCMKISGARIFDSCRRFLFVLAVARCQRGTRRKAYA